jgi:hypothetical protein
VFPGDGGLAAGCRKETTMSEATAGPEEIRDILRKYKVVAVVGLSPKPERPSFQVAQYLKDHGYRIVPVNPGQKEILGETCYRNLTDIPFPGGSGGHFPERGGHPGHCG